MNTGVSYLVHLTRTIRMPVDVWGDKRYRTFISSVTKRVEAESSDAAAEKALFSMPKGWKSYSVVPAK